MDPTWRISELRQHLAVIDGKKSPNIVLKNARYLHSMLKQWVVGNIWISGDRIVYAGDRMPPLMEGTEIVDCTNKTIVPGYIEPHVHPFQLYHPQSFADFCGQLGTTTFISDNLSFVLSLENKKAFSILDNLKKLPFSFYWWTRFDSQTEMVQEEEIFSNTSILEWLQRDDVLLGGELTGWPRLLHGDDLMLYRMQMAKAHGKKIEGHFPGASERTLARMKLLGADGDHEAMTVEEVERRIMQGFAVTLRHSSIRPDLPILLKGIVEKQLPIFDHLMMTTDGSTPSFHQDGVMDKCIQVALDAGVSPIDAYQMASYNVARYYNMSNLHGFIATGRFASLNILQDEWHPVPESVLSKGVWLKRDGERVHRLAEIDYSAIPAFDLDFSLTAHDFQFSMPFGIELVNDVITKPYNSLITREGQLANHDESYLILMNRSGNWHVNTMIKGFATNVQGFASSYSNTGDILLIGKNKDDMLKAFEEMKAMGGGIVLVEKGEVIASVPLTIGGLLYQGDVEDLTVKELALKQALAERGYRLGDAIYTLLFLQSTHLPYIRITPKGIFDVMKNKLLLPAVMR
ncbi:adenine deaminase C-terminal domain-containing protein [Lysinibacillus sp. 38-6]|uniref:adenine deaminase C-terminal domain-containing protein n=1 Tax=Lysinibacillus sp. 38-6 TaxID=3385991 RepID=UPI003908B923